MVGFAEVDCEGEEERASSRARERVASQSWVEREEADSEEGALEESS